MNTEQEQTISKVLQRFQEMENIDRWTPIDDCLISLDWLDDRETLNEAYLVMERHRWGNPRCEVDHPRENCVVPMIIEAVDSLLNFYNDKKEVTKDHRLIFQYYIALSYTGDIVY